MSLYNVEFFDRFLNCTYHTQTDFTSIESDYLSPENSSIEVLKTDKIKIQDIVLIQELPDYVGIVESVDQNEYTTTVQIKPFVTVFNQPILFDTSGQYGEMEFIMGLNSFAYDTVDFYIFLKPSNYKFGLFNAGGENSTQFKNIDAISRDKIRFISKFGCNKFDASKNKIYGPRVCVDGTVSQPDVSSGTYLYYMLDSNDKSTYGKWDRNMRKTDDWFRDNVQMCCSPDVIFSADLEAPLCNYSSDLPSDTVLNVSANWSFFGKDRHGRFFSGVNPVEKARPTDIWSMLVRSCGIAELAFMGGGYTEGDSTFIQPKDVGEMIAWRFDVSYTCRNNGTNIGDTLAFYEVLNDDDQSLNPNIVGRPDLVQLHPNNSLEFALDWIIRGNWITREHAQGYTNDELMALPIYCTQVSSTKDWTLSIKPDNQNRDGSIFPSCIVDFYGTILQEAFRKYRVAIAARVDWELKKIELLIGKSDNPVHIDTSLPNVKVKECVVEKIQNNVNKLVIWDSDGYDDIETYYLHTDGTYDTNDTNRIFPVVQKLVSVDAGDGDIPFKSLAKEQAVAEFGDVQWRNYIELEMYNPPEIQLGQLCYVHHEGETYVTVLSGFKDGIVKTLMFGAYRSDYTKSMRIQNYENATMNKNASKNAFTATTSARTYK